MADDLERLGLIRLREYDTGTEGVLVLPEGVMCNTLELPWRDNKVCRSCIPCGEYLVETRVSPRFGKVYEVKGVEGRTYILIHAANLAGDVDKGLVSHLEGCVALGKYFGTVAGQRGILSSFPAVRAFEQRMAGRPFRLLVDYAWKERV